MSKIRIYSKKAYAIGPGAQRGTPGIDCFYTVPMAFQDMPEKYKDDPTFKLAVKSGNITIIEHNTMVQGSAPTPPVVENNGSDAAENPVDDPVAEYYAKVKAMSKDEVKAECEKYNAEFIEDDKLKENKKRLMEAFKLSLSEQEDPEGDEE